MSLQDKLTHCGIKYFDPAYVDTKKKEHYWRHTARIMQHLGMASTQVDPEETRVTFKALPLERQEHILLLQRQALVYLHNNWALQDFIPFQPTENTLPVSFIREEMNKMKDIREILDTYKETSYSYQNKNIAGLFGQQDRLYIPLDQFHQSSKPQNTMMVLSRHPYDLFRMATKRRWNNCMSHNGVNFKYYVPQDIKKGTLVAYAVNFCPDSPYGSDWNINDPTTRCLIKPLTAKNTLIYQRDYFFGEFNNSFRVGADEVTKQWLCREGIPNTTYYLNGLYSSDCLPDEFEFRKQNLSNYPIAP